MDLDRLLSRNLKLLELKYRLEHWFYQWHLDGDDDITLTIAGFIHLTKYKEHTIVKFGGSDYRRAPKYLKPDDELRARLNRAIEIAEAMPYADSRKLRDALYGEYPS